jgi:uncharacterized protein (DUF2236 family)
MSTAIRNDNTENVDHEQEVPALDEKITSLQPHDGLNEKASERTTTSTSDAITPAELMSPDFNPEGMRKVARESILLAGGAYAILLQVAMAGVASGVDEHSNFAYRPSDRLRTTMTYVYCMVYGTPEEKRTIIEMVHKAHSVVKGKDYTADDVELQLWVAATLYGAGTEIYEKFFGKIDDTFADRTYREYSVLATSLRVPPDMWPANRAAFWKYWDDKINTLEINSNAKNVCGDLLFNKKGPWWIRANLPVVRVVTAEWLSPRMREAYGLKQRHKTYKVLQAVAQAIYPALPRRIRTYPVNFYLKDMRKRMKIANDGSWK